MFVALSANNKHYGIIPNYNNNNNNNIIIIIIIIIIIFFIINTYFFRHVCGSWSAHERDLLKKKTTMRFFPNARYRKVWINA